MNKFRISTLEIEADIKKEILKSFNGNYFFLPNPIMALVPTLQGRLPIDYFFGLIKALRKINPS
jgi:hypothetical protein